MGKNCKILGIMEFIYNIYNIINGLWITNRKNNFLIQICWVKANSEGTIRLLYNNEWIKPFRADILNYSHITTGTFLGGFCIGTPFCFVVIYTGLHLNLPIPLKRWAYFGWLTIDSLVRLGGSMFESVHLALVECKSVCNDEFMESTLGVKSIFCLSCQLLYTGQWKLVTQDLRHRLLQW